MTDLSISEFADSLMEILRFFHKDFGKKHVGEILKGRVTLPQLMILDFLHANSPVKMTDVARFLGITTAAVTGMVDRLVKAGYVLRSHDLGDRRIVLIRITKKGALLVGNIHNSRREMIISLFSKVSQADREEYLRILMKVREAISGNQDSGNGNKK